VESRFKGFGTDSHQSSEGGHAATLRGYNDIVKGLNGYIQYWTAEGQRNVTGLYKYQYAYCIEYWSRVWDALLNPEMEACNTLFMGF
jgi:hypothetical protein